MPIQKRSLVCYTQDEEDDMESDRIVFREKLKKMARGKRGPKVEVFSNQKKNAWRIMSIFSDLFVCNVLVLAETQSGKTGTMLALIKVMMEKNKEANMTGIPIENIYVITGLSSIEWKEQTMERMPDDLSKNIYHLDTIKKFIKDVKGKKNTLIIMDEVQIAAKKGQTLCQMFDELNLCDTTHLMENDIKLVQFTATPDGNFYDHLMWGNASRRFIAKPGDGYVGCVDLLRQKRIFQWKDLCGWNKKTKKVNPEVFGNIEDLKTVIEKFGRCVYTIIRCPSGDEFVITKKNIKQVFGETSFAYDEYIEDSNNHINSILTTEPSKNTVIFVKEKLRCSVTLYKKYLGVLYDRKVRDPNDSVDVQSLPGRATGYDDNGETIVYTHMDSILKYERLVKSEFMDPNVDWRSNTTTRKGGKLRSTGTFNMNRVEKDKPEKVVTLFQKEFHGFDLKTINRFIEKNVEGATRCKSRRVRPDGYYETPMRENTENEKSTKRVVSYEEWKEKSMLGWGFDSKRHLRLHLYYMDVTDKESLRSLVVYKKKKENAEV